MEDNQKFFHGMTIKRAANKSYQHNGLLLKSIKN